MTANVRAFVPILGRLRSTGWQRIGYGHSLAVEHVWRRGGTANLQQITVNISGASVFINGRTFTTDVLELGEAFAALTFLGAFEPAPERVDYRRAA